MKTSKKTSTKKPVAKKIDPVVHFEMPAEDRKRMAKFYTSAFGWQTQMLGEDMGNYVLATTTAEVDKKGRPKKRALSMAVFIPKVTISRHNTHRWLLQLIDIKKSMNKVTKAGGKVIGEPMEIPGFGMYVSFFDTEGNRVSIMEPTMEMKEKAKGGKKFFFVCLNFF